MRARKRTNLAFWSLGAVTFLLLNGCEDSSPPQEKPIDSRDTLVNQFNPQIVGSITGTVQWFGDVPHIEPFDAPVSPQMELRGGEWLKWPNPNVPMVDPKTNGVGNAVVFLRGIDPQYAKPWSHAPVLVEQREYQFHVVQGPTDGHFGFVRRGDEVEMVSRQDVFHSLRAGGAAFFTLAFPDADEPLTRKLHSNGIVELTSAAGYFWMRSYLFVDEHPYYCRTDSHGHFTLDQVPPGRYEIVCWMPNWHKHAHDRDPETTLFSRWYFAAPLEVIQTIQVENAETSQVDFRVSKEAFAPK